MAPHATAPAPAHLPTTAAVPSSLRWSGTPPPRLDPFVVRPSGLAQLQSSLLLVGMRPRPGGQALGRRLRHPG
ncbi:hypothetical protein Zm00014a_034120 [Zea mays]|uniref:Uncharacterized protein n=1 Tax=Zea mays TaxID=4577 RepID=A0A3L6DN82_MAIZE|nr:hypothetical protein Zm00014a_034120 [Zea mays]